MMRGPRRRRGKNTWLCYTLLVQYFAWFMCFVTFVDTAVATLCDLNSGSNTIQDNRGDPHSVNISVTRDGSVWLRVGVELRSYDWDFLSEPKEAYHETILSKSTIELLQNINYTDTCVLSDLKFEVRMDYGWHPSYVYVFNTIMKSDYFLAFRHNKDCHMNTTLQLSANKQTLVCHGGERHGCGFGRLPLKGKHSGTVFIRDVVFAPEGENSVACLQPVARNSFTFKGSYYHAYVKLASCPPLQDSREFGQEPKMRSNFDRENNMVLIPDPTRTALAQGTIRGWRVFVQEMSIQHQVYLQVWRPSTYHQNKYYLVNQTPFTPTELQFQEVHDNYLSLTKNDVLGIYFPHNNPIAFTAVPCASTKQRHMYVRSPEYVAVGQTLQFTQAAAGDLACRQYSFTAVLANKSSAKLMDDWVCPNQLQNSDTIKRESAQNVDPQGKKKDLNKSPPPPEIDGDMAVSVNYILLIIGGLLLLMITIGSFSYYRAIKS